MLFWVFFNEKCFVGEINFIVEEICCYGVCCDV